MEVCIISESDVSASLDVEIKDCLCHCFPDEVESFSHSRGWHESMPAWTVLLRDEGKIVAHVGVVDRRVRVGNAFVRVGGVQNVCVLPECRGKGYADPALDAAMQEGARRGFDAGLLFCKEALEHVYARAGWFTLPDREVIRVDDDGEEKPLPEGNIVMVKLLAAQAFPDGPIHLQGNDW